MAQLTVLALDEEKACLNEAHLHQGLLVAVVLAGVVSQPATEGVKEGTIARGGCHGEQATRVHDALLQRLQLAFFVGL